jgi:hypothetical protein
MTAQATRCVATRVLQLAIDDMAGIITDDRKYFYAKPLSLAKGPSGTG